LKWDWTCWVLEEGVYKKHWEGKNSVGRGTLKLCCRGKQAIIKLGSQNKGKAKGIGRGGTWRENAKERVFLGWGV